jgi:hypothetical protein
MSTIQDLDFNTPQTEDYIKDLQTDNSKNTENEIDIINSIFKEEKNEKTCSQSNELQNILLIGVLFFIFSLPQIDIIFNRLLQKFNNSIYAVLVVKTLLFMIFYYIIKNLF